MWRSSSLAAIVVIPVLLAAQSPVRRDSIAPGVYLLTYQTPAPHSIKVLAVDRSTSHSALGAYRGRGLVRTSTQAQENERTDHRVLAAINADFFSFETGRPVGNQIADGKFVAGARSKRSHVAILGETRPFIEQLSFFGAGVWHGIRIDIDGVNQEKGKGTTVLYNSYWGKALPQDSCCFRIDMRLADGWKVADTMLAIVKSGETANQNTNDLLEATFMVDRRIFYAHHPEKGDTVKLFLGFEGDRRPYAQVLGGGGRILKEGEIVGDGEREQEGIRARFFTDRHPRTFVGFDRDTTVVFLCVVDGRQAASAGMTFREMGEFLLKIGAWNAVNLDGGGSTTMVVRHEVVNSPSDSTGERPVANTLQLVAKEIIDHSRK